MSCVMFTVFIIWNQFVFINGVNRCVYLTEPEGMSAPEVVPVNSSTARVLWIPPLRPNGAVTGYNIYVNDRLHGNVDNSSGSYLLRDLLPFTVYNIQVLTNKCKYAKRDIYCKNMHHGFLLMYFSGGGVHSVCMHPEQRYQNYYCGGPACWLCNTTCPSDKSQVIYKCTAIFSW